MPKPHDGPVTPSLSIHRQIFLISVFCSKTFTGSTAFLKNVFTQRREHSCDRYVRYIKINYYYYY
jgi:hypothetical protein